MPDDLSKEDIAQYSNNRQPNQPPDQTLEQLLLNSIPNPQSTSTSRTRVMDGLDIGVISETREGSRMHEDGYIEDIKEERVYTLDDGTSLNGIVKCQTCGGIVKEETSLRRCGCGKTCCVRPGCGKYSKKNDNWYCCNWHAFLDFLTIPLR